MPDSECPRCFGRRLAPAKALNCKRKAGDPASFRAAFPSLRKQRADRFLVGNAGHGFGKELRTRERANALAGPRFLRERDRVADDDLVEVRLGDPRDSAAGEHRMRAVREYLASAAFLERARGLAQ